MFGLFAKKMTEASRHYLDWSNVAKLVRSGKHRYTNTELAIRGGMVVVIAGCGFLGSYLNDKEKTGASDLTVSIICALFGLVLSHGLAMYPLLNKRYELESNCNHLVIDIMLKLPKRQPALSDESYRAIQETIQAILKLSLSDEKQGRATQTWGRRMGLLTKLQERLNDTSIEVNYWQGAANEIIDKLSIDPPAAASKLKLG